VRRNTFAAAFAAVCGVSALATLVVHGPGSTKRIQSDGLIVYGHELVTQTFAEVGPEVHDPTRRFAGNNLACQNCHLNGGTNPHALPLAGAYRTFPKFSQRDGRVISLDDRINECMTRSMNGRELPLGSREMSALLAYLQSIGDPPVGQAAPVAPQLAGDPVRGAEVFARDCAVCHQPDGLGKRRGQPGDAHGYLFPPLWGPDSFNTGAGMNEDRNFVRFARANMPRGVNTVHPLLSWQDAADVAAYVRTKPRPALE
jgi:thiosulfate dehydrogenase